MKSLVVNQFDVVHDNVHGIAGGRSSSRQSSQCSRARFVLTGRPLSSTDLRSLIDQTTASHHPSISCRRSAYPSAGRFRRGQSPATIDVIAGEEAELRLLRRHGLRHRDAFRSCLLELQDRNGSVGSARTVLTFRSSVRGALALQRLNLCDGVLCQCREWHFHDVSFCWMHNLNVIVAHADDFAANRVILLTH